MSRFIDKLNAATGAGTQSMGFRPGPAEHEKSRIKLVAGLARADINLASVVGEADASVVRISSLAEVKALEKLCQSEKMPWGAWVKGEGLARMAKTGCDFVIFPASDTPIAMPKNDKVGHILEVDSSLSEGLLRTIDDLPVDAVFVANETEVLTWRHLMQFSRMAGLVGKPLLVSVPPGVTANELQSLWEVGVSGVVIKVADEQTGERLATLRQEIEKLTCSSIRKPRRTLALLPRISAEPEVIAEEEEEEEEE